MILKASLRFATLSDTDLDNFAQKVINCITGNATYPTPPVTLAALQTARNDFTTKIATAQGGSVLDTANKNNSRQTLLGILRKYVNYVQINCDDDMAKLVSSGFDAMSTNRASVPLDQPQDLNVDNGNTGELIASVKALPNSSMYKGRAKPDGGDWLPSAFSGDSRRIVIAGLTPGTMYTVEVRALGGQTGQSPWSDPTSHRSM